MTTRSSHRLVLAFLVGLAGVGCFSIMDALVKGLVMSLGLVVVSSWRAILNLAFASALYLPRRQSWPERQILRIHVARGLVMTLMSGLFFWGIARVPLAHGTAITFIAPLVAQLLSGALLNERVSPRSVAGSVLGFAGVLTIAWPQLRCDLGSPALLGSAAVFVSAICYALNIILMRRQALAADPLEISFFQSLTIAACWWAFVTFTGIPSWPSAEAGTMIAASLLSTSAVLLLAWAYKRAEAGYLAVGEYSAFLWATALGWLLFHERLAFTTGAGAALIIGGCVVAMGSRPLSQEMELAS